MSLLHELQELTERTYQHTSGINLEKFIIGRRRFRELNRLAGKSVRDLSDVARTFFRVTDDRLYLAIYYSHRMIRRLERYDPRRGLHEKNILPFSVFIEELNHAIHAALKFLGGEQCLLDEHFNMDLELMAKVDCYQTIKFFLAHFNSSGRLEKWDRMWIRSHLFEGWDYGYDSPQIRTRYAETNQLGEKYTRYLDHLTPESRVAEIRRFRVMRYPQKRRYILMLP